MISEDLQAALNKQAAEEAYASSVYLAMAAWCESNGYTGCAAYLNHSSDEERDHMRAFLKYVIDQAGVARVPAVKEPPHEWDGIPEIFRLVLDLEMDVASKIHRIVDQAIAEKDHAAHNWLQAFVAEQRDAEIKGRQILDMIKLIGTGGTGLYEIDRAIGDLAKAEG